MRPPGPRAAGRKQGWFDPQELDFALEVIAHVDTPMIMTLLQPIGATGQQAVEVFVKRPDESVRAPRVAFLTALLTHSAVQ
jgi:hypothetical protein